MAIQFNLDPSEEAMSVSARPMIPLLRLSLMGLLMGSWTASAETPTVPVEPVTVQVTVEEAPSRFSAAWLLARCERYLPVCQPAIAQRALDGQFQGLLGLPNLRPVPSVDLDPRLAHVMTSVATGLVLRTARDVATDPFSVDPTRYFSPAQRDMVGITTPSDQLGELSRPILGSNSFRPTPKSSEDTSE